MQHGIYVAPFDELSDPRTLAELAARAEATGWGGFFIWDHVAYREPVREICDPWIALAAIACATERVRIGPLVTPLARRRPNVVARQAASLDHLSGGRVVLGIGLGGDAYREFSGYGDAADGRDRAPLLDEAMDLIARLWSGERVDHGGPAFQVDGMTALPRPVQQPRIPVWVATRFPNQRPLARAARWDGVFPIELEPSDLPGYLDAIRALREDPSAPYDVVVTGSPGDDTAAWERAGATWWLSGSGHTPSLAAVRETIEAGPPR